MNYKRAVAVSVWSGVIAVVSGVGAGVYWGWWNARQKQSWNADSTPVGPLVLLAAVTFVAFVVALVVGLVAALAPRDQTT